MESLIESPPEDAFRAWRDEIDEITELSPIDLEQRFAEAEQRRRRAEAEQALLIAEMERLKWWRRDGHASVFGFLRASPHWSEAECRSRTKLSRLLADHPAIAESLWHGRISVANADVIARLYANPRLGDRFPEVVGMLQTEGERREHDDFKLIASRWELLVDAGTRAERAAAHERRDAHLSIVEGEGTLLAHWGDLDSARNREIFERFVEAEFEADWAATKAEHGDATSWALLPRTNAQRRADALTAIFTTAASTPAGSRPPKPVGVIHVGWEHFSEMMTLAGLFPERVASDPFDDPTPHIADMRCETGDGDLINPDVALQVLLEGHVRFVIHDDKGIPIRWGRQRRLFTGAARDAVISLSHRCTQPGCRVRASRCDADHLRPHNGGGLTDADNGAPRCRRENRFKHAEGLTVTFEADRRFHTYRPDGTEI
jgi:hypothetical protein